MEQIKIALFHYHFLPGGVTTVASYAVKALLEYGKKHGLNIEKIVFISGEAENMKNITANAENAASQNTEYYVDTSIGYLKENITKEEEQNIGGKIKNLFNKYSGYVWWVHNYHLGKNPIFTQLLTNHLTENSFQKAILHIHDFPECARFDNYQFLTKYIDKKLLYPIGENIRYAVINHRDACYLKEAGIPESCVKLIYNPVPSFTQPLKNNNSDAKNKIISAFKDCFPSIDPEKPFALYPVRTIRRKNILEAALLSHIAGNGFNLIVTLPGISVQEKNYSNIVEKFFKDGTISGIWGTGKSKLIPFSQIIEASDFIISSSVVEGFGYLFLDSLRWGKPLIAKYLDIIEGFSDTFSKTSSFFYNYIAVPSSLVAVEKIKEMYRDNIKIYSNFIAKEVVEEAERQIESILSMEEIDFSYLPVDSQVEILKLVKNDNSIRKIVAELNSNTTEKIAEVIMHKQDFNRQKGEEYFSFESYSDTFCKIILSLEEKLPHSDTSTSSPVAENILNLFLRPEFLRLILS